MVSDLTYDLRSGEPDSIDQIVATTFANIAVELIREGVSGRMIGIQSGHYAHVPLPDSSLGARKVDVRRALQHRALPAELLLPNSVRPAIFYRLLISAASAQHFGGV